MDGKAVNDPLTGVSLNRNSEPSDQLRYFTEPLIVMIGHRSCKARHALLVADGGHRLLFERRRKVRIGKAACGHDVYPKI